jgi:hypothetical protein
MGFPRLVPFFVSGIIAATGAASGGVSGAFVAAVVSVCFGVCALGGAGDGGVVEGVCFGVAGAGAVFARLGDGGALVGGSWLGSQVGAFRLVPFPIPSSCAGLPILGHACMVVRCAAVLSVCVMVLVTPAAGFGVVGFGIAGGFGGCGSGSGNDGAVIVLVSIAVAVLICVGVGLVGGVCSVSGGVRIVCVGGVCVVGIGGAVRLGVGVVVGGCAVSGGLGGVGVVVSGVLGDLIDVAVTRVRLRGGDLLSGCVGSGLCVDSFRFAPLPVSFSCAGLFVVVAW